MEYDRTKDHKFVKACREDNTNQKFTRSARLQTNGEAERVIRTLLGMWHDKVGFADSRHRQREPVRFLNFCNTVAAPRIVQKGRFGKESVTLTI